MAFEQGGLHVVAAVQVIAKLCLATAAQHLGTLLFAQIQVREDLGQLLFAGLGTHHGVGVQRVAVLDGGHALERLFHELLVNAFLDERAAGAGADLALVEGEQHQTFDGFVEEAVVLVHHVGKEDVGALAAQFQRGGNEVVGRCLGNDATGAGGTGESNFGNALAGGQGHAGFAAITVDDVEHAGGQEVGNQLGQDQDGNGGAFSRLEHHAVACTQCGGQLPRGHQNGEVPGNDLAHHAQRLVDVISHGVFVDLADASLLRTQGTGKVTEVVHRQRNVGVQRFPDGLAVVHGFGIGQQFQVGFDAVGNFQQDVAARGGISLAPFVGSSVGCIQCQVDVLCCGTGDLRVHLAGGGGDHVEVLPFDRRDPLATDEVVVLGFVDVFGAGGAGGCVNHVISCDLFKTGC